MNVKSYNTKDYENKSNWTLGQNKANSNPISEKPKMNVNLYVIEDYENETALRLQKNKPKQIQFQTRCTFCEFFLFFTFLCPTNLAMQTWTIQKLLNWVTEYLTESLLNLSINIADSANCNVLIPRPVSGTGCSYLGRRKMPLKRKRNGKQTI